MVILACNDGKFQSDFGLQDSVWCWCVNPQTGVTIGGTSTQNKRPNCDDVISRPNSHSASPALAAEQTAWKKCPTEQKEQFLKNLMIYLTYIEQKEVSKDTSSGSFRNSEAVARWHFRQMDINKDGVSSIR